MQGLRSKPTMTTMSSLAFVMLAVLVLLSGCAAAHSKSIWEMRPPTKAERIAHDARIDAYVAAHPELRSEIVVSMQHGDFCNGLTKEQVKVMNDDPPYREDETHLWYRGAWWNDLYTFKDGVLVETGRWK